MQQKKNRKFRLKLNNVNVHKPILFRLFEMSWSECCQQRKKNCHKIYNEFNPIESRTRNKEFARNFHGIELLDNENFQ